MSSNKLLAIQGGSVKVSHFIFPVLILFTVGAYANKTGESNTVALFKALEPIFIQKIDLPTSIYFPKDASSAYKSAMRDCFISERNYLYNLMAPSIEQHLNHEQIESLVSWFKQDNDNLLIRILSGDLKQGDLSEKQISKLTPFTQTEAFQKFLPATASLAENAAKDGDSFVKFCKSIANKAIK
jgi:hypothetical protein